MVPGAFGALRFSFQLHVYLAVNELAISYLEDLQRISTKKLVNQSIHSQIAVLYWLSMTGEKVPTTLTPYYVPGSVLSTMQA